MISDRLIMDPDVPFCPDLHVDQQSDQQASQTGRLVIPDALGDTRHEPPLALVERLNELAGKDLLPGEAGPGWEQVVQSHADGNGYPVNEYELQELLNTEHISPTFSLTSLPGANLRAEMSKHQAKCVVWRELETNFRNAIAHVREARELYPEDELFSQTDLQVLMHVKNNDPPRQEGEEEPTKKRGKLGSLFKKKDKDASTNRTKEGMAADGGEAALDGSGSGERKKKKEKKEKKEKKKKKEKDTHSDENGDEEAPEKEKKRFGLFKKKKKGAPEPTHPSTHPHDQAAEGTSTPVPVGGTLSVGAGGTADGGAPPMEANEEEHSVATVVA